MLAIPARCRVVRAGTRLAALSVVVVACASKGNYFDEPPPPQRGGAAGRGVSAGAPGTAGALAMGGGAGLSAGGSPSAGRMGGTGGATSAGKGGNSMGGAGVGGSGAVAGTEEGATGGEPATGATAGSGGSGGSAGHGASSGTGGSGGTGGTGQAGDNGVAGAGDQPCVPTPELCDGVSNDCDDAIDEGDVCPTGCSAKTRDGHVYLLCVTKVARNQLDFGDATLFCADAGDTLDLGFSLSLARIESAPESEFAKDWVKEVVTGEGAVWIGANDRDEENTWVWGRGADAVEFFVGSNRGGGMPYEGAFNDWGDGRPNSVNGVSEDCGAMDSEVDWLWNDILCGTPRIGFLCEQEP